MPPLNIQLNDASVGTGREDPGNNGLQPGQARGGPPTKTGRQAPPGNREEPSDVRSGNVAVAKSVLLNV